MNELLNLVATPLSYSFMVRGLVAAIIVGVVCATVGTYVVLRGMAFFGDALAHAILPGVAVGYLIGGGARGPLFWGAMLASILTSLGIGALSKGRQLKEDTAIGVIFAGMFALGIALISTVHSYSVDLTHFLFGDVLGVSRGDLWLTAGFGGLVVLTLLALYKEFMVLSFDPVLAATMRLPASILHYLLLLLIAVTIVVSLQTVGIALMVAMLVTPAATAYLLARRLPAVMSIGAAVGALSAIIGLYLSFYVNIASGAAIVLVCTAFFILAFLFAPSKGALRAIFRNQRT
jgi:ABC-type Mn2+/Zn2+ transport system permease subunit